MQKVFDLTNKNITLLTPLILFSIFSTIYLSISANGRLVNVLLAMVLFLFMTSAFLAGWLYMTKLAVEENSSAESVNLIKEFPSGVGEYFLPSLGAIIIMFIFGLGMTILSFKFGMKFIGDAGITPKALVEALETTAALKAFITSLSAEQIFKLNQWNLLLLGVMSFTYYLLMFYLPALFYKTKNSFKAFFIGIKNLFNRKFIKTLGIYLLIFFLNFFITFLSVIFSNNLILHFLVTFLNFYFITIVAVGIFYYYNENFVKPLIGQNIDVRL